MPISELTARHEYLLIDFYADWCEPCKWLNPVLDELKTKLPQLHIHKINVDVETAVANSLIFAVFLCLFCKKVNLFGE